MDADWSVKAALDFVAAAGRREKVLVTGRWLNAAL
jgi:hypothetical protein